jgi:hypothetical protein
LRSFCSRNHRKTMPTLRGTFIITENRRNLKVFYFRWTGLHTHPHQQITRSLYTPCCSMKHHPESIHSIKAIDFEDMKIWKYEKVKKWKAEHIEI